MFCQMIVFILTFYWLGSVTALPKEISNDCSKPCKDVDDLRAPHCNQTTRIEPEYDDCGCLTGYRCCPSVCPLPKDNCNPGYEIPVNVTDCCGCPAVRCDACPKISTPKCVAGCQEVETLADVMNGCLFKSCTTVCPQMDEMVCPSCYEPVSFRNESFCQCTQQRCTKKLCPPKVELPSKECAIRKWAKTECGCDKQFYETASYCERHNAEAAAKTCQDKCFTNVVRRGKGVCNCDKAECVRISEDCKQVFPGWDCPKGFVKVSGTTPCGLDREICIKCDDGKLEADTCDPECNRIVQDKDANGCPLQRCVRKECAPFPPLPGNCVAFKSFNLTVDKCGCVSWEMGYCIDGDAARDGMMWHFVHETFYSVHKEPLMTWPNARDFCLEQKARLAVIETPAEEAALKNLINSQKLWVGGKCEKNRTGSFYFWDTAGGRVAFDFSSVPSSGRGRTGTFASCDTNVDGIVFSRAGFDDVDQHNRRGFICEMP